MAMIARLWSLSALATELDLDRRTVAARLRHVPPDGELNGHAAWLLPTALRALRPGGGRAPVSFAPTDCSDTPFGQGAIMGHNATIYGLPRCLAEAAIAAGLTMDQAFALTEPVTHAVARATAKFLGRTASSLTEGGCSTLHAAGCVAAIDWPELRTLAGEPDWTPPHAAPGWADHPSE